jgi:uncharacterized protein DUF998
LSSEQRSRILLLAAVVGVILYAALDALAQSLPPHYSPLSQAESDLAVGPYGYIMAVNFINRGVLSFLFLLGFARAVKPLAEYKRGYFLIGVWAFGSMILAAFPTDVSGSPTIHGAIHLAVALIAFLGGVFGELALSKSMSGDHALAGVGRYASWIAILAFISLAALFLGPSLASRVYPSISGLVERVFIGLVLVWMLAVSSMMMRPSTEARTT